MKKMYEAPKAERMDFNYSEAVVASGPKACETILQQTWIYVTTDEPCRDKETPFEASENAN